MNYPRPPVCTQSTLLCRRIDKYELVYLSYRLNSLVINAQKFILTPRICPAELLGSE